MNKFCMPLLLGLIFILFFASCESNTNRRNLLLGKWNILSWNGSMQNGTIIFSDSNILLNIHNNIEISTYKFNKDTLHANKAIGETHYLSASDYWIVNKLDTLFLRLEGSNGNVCTAYKLKNNSIKNKQDTVYIKL